MCLRTIVFIDMVFFFILGFHLSGNVKEPANPIYSEPEKEYRVSISFDR